MRIVEIFARCVYNEEELSTVAGTTGPGHHQVIDGSAILVQELSVPLLTRLKIEDVSRHKRLERRGGRLVTRADKKRLPHVRNVEEPSFRARVQVLLQNAERILYRHLVARKRHHLRAKLHMKAVKWRTLQRGSSGVSAHEFRGSQVRKRLSTRAQARSNESPLCRE